METVLIFCVEQLDNGTSFAIREDNGESVFVPSTIANRVNLQIGDSVNAKLVANAKLPEKTPWFAVRVDPASSEGTTPPVKNDDLKSRVRDVIYGSKTYFTLDDVCEELSIPLAQGSVVDEALSELFQNGTVCRAAIELRPGSDVGEVLWASSVECFLGEAE